MGRGLDYGWSRPASTHQERGSHPHGQEKLRVPHESSTKKPMPDDVPDIATA
jgi:hypothetical protein